MFELLGSTRSDPIAFVPKLFDKNVHVGVVARALFVRQIPPPAAPTQRRQLLVLQVGAMASAVMRPEVIYGAPLKVNTSGKPAVLGPINVQEPGECELEFSVDQPFFAAMVESPETSSAEKEPMITPSAAWCLSS